VPEELVPVVERMSELAVDMLGRTVTIIAERDIAGLVPLRQLEAELDELRAGLLRELVGSGWSHSVEAAVDLALLGRYYERIGDHTVSVAKRIDYVITGERP
jgi:phosphate transport system protein